MSANSLGQLAFDRDHTPPGENVGTATEVLVASIPTEALAAYTSLVGAVFAAGIANAYQPFRWTAYVLFVTLAILAPLAGFRHRVGPSAGIEHRRIPVLECLAAGLAAAAWGLVMPGSPLSTVLHGNGLVFATTSIVLGTTSLLALLAQPLGTANAKSPRAVQDGQERSEDSDQPAVVGLVPTRTVRTPSDSTES
jgi:hypothetical protein